MLTRSCLNPTQSCDGVMRARGSTVSGGVKYICERCGWEVMSYGNKPEPFRPSREDLHMRTAFDWAERSTCKRNQCGAVVVNDSLTRILSIGYNGPARLLPNDRCRGTEGSCGCLHAEDNAIAKLTSSAPGKVIFCTTAPCELCAERIVNADICKVYYVHPYRNDDGIGVLADCKINVQRMLPPQRGLMTADQVVDFVSTFLTRQYRTDGKAESVKRLIQSELGEYLKGMSSPLT